MKEMWMERSNSQTDHHTSPKMANKKIPNVSVEDFYIIELEFKYYLATISSSTCLVLYL